LAAAARKSTLVVLPGLTGVFNDPISEDPTPVAALRGTPNWRSIDAEYGNNVTPFAPDPAQ
jgi:hypothetical protein